MEGLPIVLREEKTFREIAGQYGKVIEPFDFSWDNFDVSAGSCLVLHSSGKRIDEELTLSWKNRAYPVWVREMDFCWPQSKKERLEPKLMGTSGGDESREMDLEDREIRPENSQNVEMEDTPTSGRREELGEEKPNRCMGTKSRRMQWRTPHALLGSFDASWIAFLGPRDILDRKEIWAAQFKKKGLVYFVAQSQSVLLVGHSWWKALVKELIFLLFRI
ncbi:hypothetical protein L1987_71653 [Smallanthus sonchifolius]|uniref:Uncharacterized protein n=1 Tax=Smallanthus sonchifolius TaxID=185202 RepID=A0ACB9ATB9_9ASTR|nr:hypothetical protein L1987_71653 [Smallanthus sonchifolius]